MECQFCESKILYKFLSLGRHPNPDGFLGEEDIGQEEKKYPLDVLFCGKCKLVQLEHAPNPKELFTTHFVYTTGSSGELVKNFSGLVEKIIQSYNLSPMDLAIDIGSNDGTLLSNYFPHGVRVLGVDPSEAAKLAAEKNVPTIREFFNEQTAKKILKEHGKAKAITATNVFAHVKKLDSFLKGVKLLLSDGGVFIEESHYLLDMVSKIEYDSIYAEHLRYYSLAPLVFLFRKHGMQVFDAERISTHGGSLRVYACKKGAYPVSENVGKVMKEEHAFGLHSKEVFVFFAKKVRENRVKLRKIIFDLKAEGKKIVGLGAPAKGNTLLNYNGIGPAVLDYLAEKPNLKVGKYSPGMHIPVVEESRLFEDHPDYVLLLAWNLKDIIIPKIREKGFRGKVIVPIPEPHIL